MRIILFSKLLALFTMLAMVGVFMAGAGHGLAAMAVILVQYEAAAIALAIGVTFAYPYVFGVRKGEKVLLITNDPVTNALIIRLATALEAGKLNQLIRVGLDDGSEYKCQVESYQGFISPARVSVKMENNIKVI